MADMALFQGAITGLKAASDIVKGLIGLKVDAAVNAKIIELGGEIMAAQSNATSAYAEHLAVLQRMRELEEELTRVKAWETEKQRYQLIEIHSGTFAHSLKADRKGTEPPHWICAKCYEDGKKSILQHNGKMVYHDSRVRCPTCKNEFADQHKGMKINYA